VYRHPVVVRLLLQGHPAALRPLVRGLQAFLDEVRHRRPGRDQQRDRLGLRPGRARGGLSPGLSDQDCCTLLTPRRAETRARIDDLRRIEGRLDAEDLAEELALTAQEYRQQTA